MPDWKDGLTYIKDPDAVKDYPFDFAALTNGSGATDWLASGETISSYTITAASGLAVDSFTLANSSTTVVVWISGGTAGTTYTLACRITTSAGRTEERTVNIFVDNQ